MWREEEWAAESDEAYADESAEVEVSERMPPWANISTDSDMAACWKQVLDEHGVDEPSQHGLYALAQSSEWGRRAAFGIMSKLWKKIVEVPEVKARERENFA